MYNFIKHIFSSIILPLPTATSSKFKKAFFKAFAYRQCIKCLSLTIRIIRSLNNIISIIDILDICMYKVYTGNDIIL